MTKSESSCSESVYDSGVHLIINKKLEFFFSFRPLQKPLTPDPACLSYQLKTLHIVSKKIFSKSLAFNHQPLIGHVRLNVDGWLRFPSTLRIYLGPVIRSWKFSNTYPSTLYIELSYKLLRRNGCKETTLKLI